MDVVVCDRSSGRTRVMSVGAEATAGCLKKKAMKAFGRVELDRFETSLLHGGTDSPLDDDEPLSLSSLEAGDPLDLVVTHAPVCSPKRPTEYPCDQRPHLMAASPCGRFCAVAHWFGSVTLWSTEEETLLFELPDTLNASAIAFSPCGEWLATTSSGTPGAARHAISVWRVASGRCRRRLNLETAVTSLSYSPCGSFLAGFGVGRPYGCQVKVWHAASGEEAHKFLFPAQVVSGAITRQSVACACIDDRIRVWDMEDPTRECRVLAGHSETIQGIVITEDEERVVSCSKDRSVRVWDIASGACVRVLEGGEELERLSVSGDLVAAAGPTGVWVWRLDSGEWVRVIRGHPTSGIQRGVALSPCAKWLYHSEGREVRVTRATA